VRRHHSVAGILALAGLMAATPLVAATDTTLPGGAGLSIDITTPADGVIVPLGTSVTLEGTAAIGEGSTTVASTAVVSVLDVSGSTTALVTGGDAACGDAATNGISGTILDCEVQALVNLNTEAVALGTVSEVGAVAFGTTGVIADHSPTTGSQLALIGPATDADANGDPDIEDVLRSAVSQHASFPTWGFRTFTARTTNGGSTNYQSAVQIASAVANGATATNRIVVMVSDGDASAGNPFSTDAAMRTFMDNLIPAGVIFHTFAVGDAASCAPTDPEHYGTLQAIADVSGGTCTRVADPVSLPAVLPTVVDATLSGIAIDIDGAASGATVDVTPSLPQTGPASVEWSATLASLGLGAHEVCAVASGADAGGSGTATECIDVVVHAVIANGPFGPGDGAGGDDATEGDPVPIDATVSGGASFSHWAISPGAGVDAGAGCSFADATSASTTVTCTDDGVYAITAHSSGPADTFETTLTLANADPAITAATYAPSGTVLAGTTVTITVPFLDKGVNDTESCSIDWSDLAPVAGTVTGSAGAWSCTTSRALAAGSYTATATVTDDDGGSDTADVTNGAGGGAGITLTVVDSAVSAGGPYGAGGGAGGDDATEGEDVAAAAEVIAGATFDHWSYALGAGVDAGATCAFADAGSAATTVRCTDDGVYTLTAHTTGPVDSGSASLTLLNAAPAIGSIGVGPSALVAAGTTVTVTAPFTDRGANDTHSCGVAWDDGGAASTGTIAGGSCSASRALVTPGVYRVAVTVTDDDDGSDTKAYEYVVVYDPNGGFVTGGGWLDVRAGSYPGDPALSGRATFGFVSKYRKGATIPDGNTEFQFHAAGLRFTSDAYQWLVVSGSKAQFKGTGLLDGVAGYGFLVTVTDGNVDRFRIKIWDGSGAVVFDNVLGASDGADPQAISGGSIVVHTKK
jgi:hypothetical protein